MCNFYSPERYKHESLMESLSPPLAEDLLRFLHLNIQYQVITLICCRTCATIIYTSSAFYIIQDFNTFKATAQTLNPLHCYSSTIKEALQYFLHRDAGRKALQMLGRRPEAVDVDVVHHKDIQKELTCVFIRKLHVKGQTRRLGERYPYYFPKTALDLLGDPGKNTFLSRTSISPAILWEQ